jgi:hypothetical protein
MLCSICNRTDESAGEYPLRLHKRSGEQRDVDLKLCDICAADLFGVGWITQRGVPADD